MNSYVEAFGLASGIVSVVDGAPYIRDTLVRRTQPHRGTWLIWCVLANVAFASQAAEDGAWSLVMIGTQAALTSAIWLLSLRYGVGGISKPELRLLSVAGLGLAGWFAFSSPLLATIGVVVADSVGVLMMMPKTWRDPSSETLSTFALASLAGVFSAIAVGRIDAELLLYPTYFALANGFVATVIATRRRTLKRRLANPAG
jgi:hypothetical protein